jgi:hypothetical protein
VLLITRRNEALQGMIREFIDREKGRKGRGRGRGRG